MIRSREGLRVHPRSTYREPSESSTKRLMFLALAGSLPRRRGCRKGHCVRDGSAASGSLRTRPDASALGVKAEYSFCVSVEEGGQGLIVETELVESLQAVGCRPGGMIGAEQHLVPPVPAHV